MLFPSDPMAVRAALGGVLNALDYLQLTEEARGTLELVLAEALNNVVEHAHGGRGEGIIEVCVAGDGSKPATALRCELLDDGEPMPGGAAPQTEAPAIGAEGVPLPEGGFGWLLIRELARDVDYARLEGRNRLRFRVDVLAEPRPD